MSTVSIVLPTYNRAATLKRAVVSVLEQTYEDLELIVVDDASEDGTIQVVQSFADKRIKYIPLPKRSGAGAARNAGICAASSDYIAFQDSDDQSMPAKLDVQMAALASAGDNVGVVYGDMLRILESGQETLFPAPKSLPRSLINRATGAYSHLNIGIGACLIKRSCLVQAGLFNESLPAFEDLELFMRLSEVCEFMYIPEPLVKYYANQDSTSNAPHLQASARRMILALHSDKLVGEPRVVARELISIAQLEYASRRANRL